MNKNRRKEIEDARKTLDGLLEELRNVRGKFDDLKDVVAQIKSDEEEYLDNMPESLKESDRGSAAQEAIDQLDDAENSLDTIIGELDEIIDSELDGQLEEATR